ncbi:MAG: hypothetical protein IKR80_01335, partial [Spirochaetales bacterium]|nr:hypothetical protein [Spirochaetales bacterium]
IIIGVFGILAVLVLLFIISCNVKLPKLEEECKDLEDSYMDAGFRDPEINQTILAAYTYGNWDDFFKSLGQYIKMVRNPSFIDKIFLSFSSDRDIKKYLKYI